MELHNFYVFARDSKNSQETFFLIKNAILKNKSGLCFLQTFSIKVLLTNIIKALHVTFNKNTH